MKLMRALLLLVMCLTLVCGCSGGASDADKLDVETTAAETTTSTTEVTTTEKTTATEETVVTTSTRPQYNDYDSDKNYDFEIGGILFSIPISWSIIKDDTEFRENERAVFFANSRNTDTHSAMLAFILTKLDKSGNQNELHDAVASYFDNQTNVHYDQISVGKYDAVYGYCPKREGLDFESSYNVTAFYPNEKNRLAIILDEDFTMEKSFQEDYKSILLNASPLQDKSTTAKQATITTTTTTTAALAQNTYENNECYDIIGTASFTDSINATHIIHKVKAKKNTTVEGTILAYNGNGDVIGKGTDTIKLTEGKNNYFEYIFTNSVSNAKLEKSYYVSGDNFMTGERNAVEMVKYSQSDSWLGTTLYVTVKQTGSEIGSLAKYKLLLYNGSKIVDTDYGYFSVHSSKLNGIGSTDVMEVSLFSEAKFNKVEFIYEP